MSKKIAIILVNYKDYAKKYLADCLASLKRQNWVGESKIFIVDNETSEESFRFLKEMAPEAEIIRNEKNDGFAKGNNDAIKIAIKEGFDYVILFNMDTVVDESCVNEIVKVAEAPPFLSPFIRGEDQGSGKEIGAVQARMMLWQDGPSNKINSLGNVIHFLGFGYCEGYGENLKEKNPPSPPLTKGANIGEICYPSGAAVLFKSEVLKQVGLFDEEFWMYNEDEDLGWRIWLSGFKCVLAPEAVVYHKYEFSRSIKKYYWMERNRALCILKNYRLSSLILILPAFIIMEIGLLIFSLGSGWFKEKIKVYKYFIQPSTWHYLRRERKKTQALRKVKDKDIVKRFSGKIGYQEIDSWALSIANFIFNIYWKIIRILIIW